MRPADRAYFWSRMNTPRDTLPEASDEALLVLYANGDGQAARVLVGRHAPRVLNFALRMLGGDRAEAEDVAQEAMVRLWKQAPQWRPGEAKVSTWLYRVTSNLCIDRLRVRRRRLTGLDAALDVAAGRPGAVAAMMEAQRLGAFQAALAALPERQRQAVVLRHVEGLSNPEIAAVMETGVEAVESLIARGKRMLSRDLGARREELGLDDDG